MRRIAFFALAAVVAACGLNAVGLDISPLATPGADSGGTLRDGAVTPASEDGAVPVDSDSGTLTDAGPDAKGQCDTVIDDTFDTDDARWHLSPKAKRVTGGIELTIGGQEGIAGGIWWDETIAFGASITATFDYTQVVPPVIDPQPPIDPGVGIAIGWAKSNPTWKVGDQGFNVGICNSLLDGVAAGVTLGASLRLDAIAGIAGVCETNGGLTSSVIARDAGRLTLKLVPGEVRAIWSGGGNTISTSQNATFSASGVIGFTASTGFSSAGQSVYTITRATLVRCY